MIVRALQDTSSVLECISCSSKKQIIVALSSTEAKYITANQAIHEAVWLRMSMLELQHKVAHLTMAFKDNSSSCSPNNGV